MDKKINKRLRGEEGFTLIEIIAVLIILGILAAVALPKFFDLQTDAKKKAASGAVAAAQSAISMGYASHLLGNANAPTGPSDACNGVTLDAPANITYNVTCTGGDWNVTNSAISGYYDGEAASGTWTRPQ